MAAWAVVLFGGRWRFPTLTERVYAAVTIYAAGVWISAATAVGPSCRRYRSRWQSPRSSCRFHGGRIAAGARKCGSNANCKPGPISPKPSALPGQVMSATVDVWGWRARFRLARGQTISDVVAKIPAIESGLGTFRGAVRVYPTPDDPGGSPIKPRGAARTATAACAGWPLRRPR